MKLPKLVVKALSTCAAISACSSYAADLSVEIINLTNGIHYTPFLVAAHDSNTSLFSVGQPASGSLQAMAEGGDISGLVTDLNAVGATIVENPASGLLAPAGSTTAALNTDGTTNTHLSIVSMLLPTNDGFVGLNAIEIPTAAGVYVFDVPAYDAGTEANDELVTGGGMPGAAGIPAAPDGNGGTNGTGVSGPDANTTVHIHRGNIGDSDANGGHSDVDSRIHRWLNPVARVIVTVN